MTLYILFRIFCNLLNIKLISQIIIRDGLPRDALDIWAK